MFLGGNYILTEHQKEAADCRFQPSVLNAYDPDVFSFISSNFISQFLVYGLSKRS